MILAAYLNNVLKSQTLADDSEVQIPTKPAGDSDLKPATIPT
jgi:hypothetical protein